MMKPFVPTVSRRTDIISMILSFEGRQKMKAAYIFLVILSVMCVVLGATIQKVATVMANDPEIREDLNKIRKYIPRMVKK